MQLNTSQNLYSTPKHWQLSRSVRNHRKEELGSDSSSQGPEGFLPMEVSCIIVVLKSQLILQSQFNRLLGKAEATLIISCTDLNRNYSQVVRC